MSNFIYPATSCKSVFVFIAILISTIFLCCCYYVLCVCVRVFCFVFFSFWERGDLEAVYCVLLFTMRRNCKLCNQVLKLLNCYNGSNDGGELKISMRENKMQLCYYLLVSSRSFVCYFLLHSFALHAHTLTTFLTYT